MMKENYTYCVNDYCHRSKTKTANIIFIYSSNDCWTKEGGLFYDLAVEEINKDGMSVVYTKDVEITSEGMVIFE